ncbi:PPR repeat [Musa troglodytarum]|uniref:PPR repeat n=1 Tax=Musa troglodytarum TaxID=320322 RepID=A0A9E7H0R0_9LILI|nr:PPR repeat [Musa troglodytarum]
MVEMAFLVASSSSSSYPSRVLSPTSATPNRKPPTSPRRKLRRSLAKPLLSDVRRDLTAVPHHTGPSSAAAAPSSSSTRNLLKYYARLASKLAKKGKLRDFLMIAESVLTSDAVAADSPQFVARIDPRLTAQGIAAVLRDGNLAEVIGFLSEAARLGFCLSSLFDKPALEALGLECRRLADEGKLEECVELMETLAGYEFSIKDIVDPDYILSKIIHTRDPDLAVRYASVFSHSQLLFCSILEEFGKKHDVGSAIKAFEIFKEKSGGMNMFAWRAMIDVCGLCGDCLKSRSIFEELLAQNITPNVYVFNSLMNVNAHDMSYTFGVYKHMQNLGVTADVTSYNILLKACCNAKRVDLAQNIYGEIRYMALKGALKLDVFTYTTMIKVFADAKMWQMALSIKEDMVSANVNPNIVTWSSLLSACANSGLVDHAIQLFEEMLMTGCEPNAQCCNILLYACVESCQYDRAFRLFYAWKETGFQIPFSTKDTKCDFRDVSLAIKSRDEYTSYESSVQDAKPYHVATVVPFRPTVFTFNILMKACGTDYYRAKALMDEMKTMGLTPNRISWSTLIDIYGAAQNIKGAMQAFRALRDVGIKLDVVAYTTAIKVTYNTLLRARNKYGSLHEVQQCLGIYQEMRKAGYRSNDYYLKELIEEWCEGVLCSKDQSRNVLGSDNYSEANSRKPYNLLLEKVAIHLQRDAGDSRAIDIRGLTKVEARIVVLSVLRMIKENYMLGKSIEDDIIITTEISKETMNSTGHEVDVRQSITEVLQDELGLDVRTRYGPPDHLLCNPSILPPDSNLQARRPQDLGVIKHRKRIKHLLQRIITQKKKNQLWEVDWIAEKGGRAGKGAGSAKDGPSNQEQESSKACRRKETVLGLPSSPCVRRLWHDFLAERDAGVKWPMQVTKPFPLPSISPRWLLFSYLCCLILAEMMEISRREKEDAGSRIVDSLRGRLLAERVATKAAEEEAESLAKRLEELERELAEEIRCRRRAEKRLKHALTKLESLKLAEERSCSSSQCSAMVNSGQCGPPEEVEGMAGDVSGKLVSLVEGKCSLVGTVQDHVEDEPEFRSQDASRTSCGDNKKERSMDEGSKEERMLDLIPGCRQPESEAPELQNKEDVHHVLAALRNVRQLLLLSVGRKANIYSPEQLLAEMIDVFNLIIQNKSSTIFFFLRETKRKQFEPKIVLPTIFNLKFPKLLKKLLQIIYPLLWSKVGTPDITKHHWNSPFHDDTFVIFVFLDPTLLGKEFYHGLSVSTLEEQVPPRKMPTDFNTHAKRFSYRLGSSETSEAEKLGWEAYAYIHETKI